MSDWLTPRALHWQLAAVWAAVLPHLSIIPVWLSLMLVACTGVRIQIYRGIWRFPHWSVKAALILMLLLGLAYSFDRDTLMRATVSLMVAGLASKLLEIHSRRDALVLIYLCYLLIAIQSLFGQEIINGIYALLALAVVVSAQVALFDPRRQAPMPSIKDTLRLMLPALPLMILLFLLIPRIGPLWSVPLDRASAKTGLSDSVSPGDISSMMRSDELAFRAAFDGRVPVASERYWRALVYTEFDGRSWHLDRSVNGVAEPVESAGTALRYELLMEASNRPWLPLLDTPMSVSGARLRGARQAVTDQPIDKRSAYRAVSVLGSVVESELTPEKRSDLTDFPADRNPRTQALAQLWWAESGGNPERLIERIKSQFNREFSYTLQPPLLSSADPVDQFMFETQRGFCGHFASSAALILRAAGIPARLVGGYQGGDYNRSGDYLTVRQWDAHAWVEYHLPGLGWVRFDPTAAIAPERIEQNAQAAYGDQPGFLADQPLSPLKFANSGWLLEMRRGIDALNFSWNRWVLNYHNQQSGLLNSLLGEITPLRMALALLIPGALILGFVGFNLRPKRISDPLKRAEKRLERVAKRLGYRRQPSQSWSEFALELKTVYPEQAAELEFLAQSDQLMRYAEDSVPRDQVIAAFDQVSHQLRSKPERRDQDTQSDGHTPS